MSDAESVDPLLAAAIAGDMPALEQLLLIHRRRLLGYIQRHFPAELKRVLEPQDVLQDVMFQAARSIGTFTPAGDDSLHRWLVTIARRRMVEMISARRSLKRGAGKTRGDSVAALLLELAIDENSPSQVAAGRETRRILEECLERLAPDHATAIRLRYFEALSVADIAVKMGKSERAVHMLCNRGIKALRKEMITATRFL